MPLPKYFGEKPVRKKSVKAEKKFANKVNGRTTIGSGSVFGENDVKNAAYDFEHKLTGKQSFIFKMDTWNKLERRTPSDKMPALVIEFESGERFVVLKYDDFEVLNK